MNHLISKSELELTSKIDFIVPLKQIGLITRAVLESIHHFYTPRRIIVISKRSEGVILKSLIPLWNVGRVEFIAEETFFLYNYNLTFEDIISEYDENREGIIYLEAYYIIIY